MTNARLGIATSRLRPPAGGNDVTKQTQSRCESSVRLKVLETCGLGADQSAQDQTGPKTRPRRGDYFTLNSDRRTRGPGGFVRFSSAFPVTQTEEAAQQQLTDDRLRNRDNNKDTKTSSTGPLLLSVSPLLDPGRKPKTAQETLFVFMPSATSAPQQTGKTETTSFTRTLPGFYWIYWFSVDLPSGPMSMSVTAARSQLCLKRLLDEPQGDLPKCKVARLALHPPATGLTPCLRPRSPTPKSSQSQSPSRVGPYFLFELCEGAETYRAEHAHTKQQYTCQVLPLRGYQERLAAYTWIGHHDNICSPLDVVIGQDSAYVFLPGHHGDMHAYVRSRKRLGEEEAGHLFTQMLNAVTHCHRHGVVLRDLKLRRFVFTDKYRTRLALLGLNDCVLLHGNHDDDSLTDRHGCPAYVSPELLTKGNGSYSGRAADIWSLGVSLYTMLIGRYPFQDTQPAALFAKIRRGAFSLPDWLSPQAKCLIGCMLRKLPAERLAASELLMHPWLTSSCTSHHNMHKTHHSSPKKLQNKQEDDDQVVPTWTEKH